jgi:hypothetical protein
MNIFEVSQLSDLKTLVGSHMTVIIGFTLSETPTKMKIYIRKFLKSKAKLFPSLTFIYMVVSDKDRNKLSILQGDNDVYPKMYHIRDGKNILVEVLSATRETIEESFKSVEEHYINDNDLSDEEQKMKEKIKVLTDKSAEIQKELVKDIMQRKVLESSSNT